MTEALEERVDGLLEAADRGVDDLPPLEETDDVYDALGETDGLLASAEEARSLLATTDARDLLGAVDLAELPDGREPGSIPEAIAAGDPAPVADLRVLLKLARVADADHDGDLEGALVALQGAVDARGEALERSPSDEGEASGGDEGSAREEAAGESEGAEAAEAAGEAGETEAGGDLESDLRSAMGDAIGGFGDEVKEVRDRLEAMRGDDAEKAAAEEGPSEVETDAEAPETAQADERVDAGEEAAEGADEDEMEGADEEAMEDEDESILGDAFGSDDSPPRRSTMYSTMAPPPSKRADMRHSTRFSTMPDR